MLKRLKENFEGGIEKIKWFSSLLSERLKIEISLMRLLHECEEMERKKNGLMREIGQRVNELKEQPESQILQDRVVSEALGEIARINDEIESTKKKASEISKI